MSSLSDQNDYDGAMKVYQVDKPHLITFGSFSGATKDLSTQVRRKQARQEWLTTDEMRVKSYSYSVDTLRIHFGPVTLEIMADGPTVNWCLSGSIAPMERMNDGRCLLIRAQEEFSQCVFDRDAELKGIVGQRIRHAPSANELYLVWKPGNELGIISVPLTDRSGYLLEYHCCHYGWDEEDERRSGDWGGRAAI
jgi:hypothetical protein